VGESSEPTTAYQLHNKAVQRQGQRLRFAACVWLPWRLVGWARYGTSSCSSAPTQRAAR